MNYEVTARNIALGRDPNGTATVCDDIFHRLDTIVEMDLKQDGTGRNSCKNMTFSLIKDLHLRGIEKHVRLANVQIGDVIYDDKSKYYHWIIAEDAISVKGARSFKSWLGAKDYDDWIGTSCYWFREGESEIVKICSVQGNGKVVI